MKKLIGLYKQFIPIDPNTGDPLRTRRQIWVHKIGQWNRDTMTENDEIDEFDTLAEAQTRLDELTSSDPSSRVYRIAELVSGAYVPVE